MKIIGVDRETFSIIWKKLQPQQRLMVEMMPPAILMPHLHELIFLEDNITFHTYTGPFPEMTPLASFENWVKEQ